MTRPTLPEVLISCLSFLCIPATGYSQGSPTDSAYVAEANKNALKIYYQAIGAQAGLYNGVEYKGYVEHRSDQGHPYFISDDWVDGSIEYDGCRYDDVGLMYDLVTDKVVLDQPYSHFKLELISEKIKSFTLSGHTFVRLTQSKSDSSVHSGFYDLLYDGRVKVLAAHRKRFVQRTEMREVVVQFPASEKLFIFKAGHYNPVKSKSSMLRVFADKKKELRKYIHKNSIDFRNDRDHAMARAAKFYDVSE